MTTLARTFALALNCFSTIDAYAALPGKHVRAWLDKACRKKLPAFQKYRSRLSMAGRHFATSYNVHGSLFRNQKVSLESDNHFRPQNYGDHPPEIDTHGDDGVKSAPLTPPSPSTATHSEKIIRLLKDFIDYIRKPAFIALILLAVLTGNPDFAVAATFGGRMSGRSFSSTSKTSFNSHSGGYSGGTGKSYSGYSGGCVGETTLRV